MNKAFLIWLLAIFFLATVAATQAQQPTKIPRVGWLTSGFISDQTARRQAFQQGLRELGYVEGKNILIEWRGADNIPERQRANADELVRLKVDVIVTGGDGGTRFAKAATATIPIVMVSGGDPVGTGFVASLARPGGNITGLAILRPELSGKRLELLKETVPRLARLAVFVNPASADYAQTSKEIELAAGALAVKLQSLDIRRPKDFDSAFQAATKGRADAVLFRVPNSVLSSRRKEVVELAAKNRLPAMYEEAESVEAGGVMSYGVNFPDLFRRAATYVDKILKGRKPADLPVEQPVKFEFVVNLQAAKQIGLTIPPNVLVRADRVIR